MAPEKPERGGDSSSRNAAYILIGIGVVFFIINVLDISWGRLWPLVLVIIGLYLLFGRNSIGSTVQTGLFKAALNGAKSARVNLHLSIGEASVKALAGGSDQLIDAELTYVGEIDFDVSGAAEKTVMLRQTSASGWQWINPATWFASHEGWPWRIGLNPDVPMEVEIHGGAGRAELDLRSLKVTDLRLAGGVGQMHVSLPASAAGYAARIEGGLGQTVLDLPTTTTLRLAVEGGVGELVINTPLEAAVRVRSRGGIGGVNVPSRFVRTAGGDSDFALGKTGTWETPDFQSAAHSIDIDYEGGVGQLTLR